MVHWLLFVAMALCAALLFVDLALRRASVLAALGRALAVIFQGAWLIQIAFIEFRGAPLGQEGWEAGRAAAAQLRRGRRRTPPSQWRPRNPQPPPSPAPPQSRAPWPPMLQTSRSGAPSMLAAQ